METQLEEVLGLEEANKDYTLDDHRKLVSEFADLSEEELVESYGSETPKKRQTYITGDTFIWSYPVPAPKIIEHKERICEAVVRGPDGKVARHPNGKAVKTTVVVPAYTQVIK